MIISPREKRDYNCIIQESIKAANEERLLLSIKELDDFIGCKCTYNIINTSRDMEMIKIIDACVGIMLSQYNKLLELDRNKYESNLLNFYKIIIYDLIDFRNASGIFIGVQLQGVMRSIIEHTRMYLCCLFDDNFKDYYFTEYTRKEKKNRYFEKRGKKIDKKLKDICELAIKKGETMTPKSSIKAIISEDLYKRIYDEFSELSHMSEISVAKNIINDRLEICFDSDITERYDKYYDYIMEYIVVTVIIIFAQNNEKAKCNYQDNTIIIYGFLVKVYDSIFKYRNVDEVLIKLKDKIIDIYNANE